MKKYRVVRCDMNFDLEGIVYFLKKDDTVSLPDQNSFIQSLEARGYISTSGIINPEIG